MELRGLTDMVSDLYPVKVETLELNDNFHIYRKVSHPQYICMHRINGTMTTITFFRTDEIDKRLKKHYDEHGISFTIRNKETLNTLLKAKF